MAKKGRPKLTCTLGTAKRRTFLLYDYEYIQMKKLFEKLKRIRKQYRTKEEDNETVIDE